MKLRVVALVLLAVASAAAPAHAAGWKRVTTPDGASIDQVGVLRTGDGALHLAWHHPTGPNTEDLMHTVISRAGRVGDPNPIQSGWTGFTNPALVSDPGGIRAFWGGFRSTDSNDPQKEINTALSPDGGATWSLQPGQVNPNGGQAYGSSISATVLSNGTTLQSWAGTLGTWVHAGLSPATPNHDYQAPIGPYGYDPALTTDASDRTVMAWYSNATGRLGVLAQDVAADGSPIGSAVTMPGTDDMEVGMLGRTPIVDRAGGGFYVAYPTGNPTQDRVRVWRVGAGNAPVVARKTGGQPVTLAAAGDGRLWVVWADNDRRGDARILARRSDRGATDWGATVDAGRPSGAPIAYRLDASAAGGALDILGNFNLGTSSTSATHHRRILPGLTLQARPGKLRKGEAEDVRFTVRDAGDPVKGARVKAAGKSGTTDRRGRVVLRLESRRAVTAVATRRGYVKATRRLQAR